MAPICMHIYYTRFLGATQLTTPNGSSIGSAVFARPMLHSLYTLHCAIPFPQNLLLTLGGIWPRIIHGALDRPDPPPQAVTRSNRPFFRDIHSLPTDRPTGRQNGHGTRPVTLDRSCCYKATYSVSLYTSTNARIS